MKKPTVKLDGARMLKYRDLIAKQKREREEMLNQFQQEILTEDLQELETIRLVLAALPNSSDNGNALGMLEWMVKRLGELQDYDVYEALKVFDATKRR